MALKLKIDDQGRAVLKEVESGLKLPVYVEDDGTEIEVDVPNLFLKITEVSAEAKGYRKEKAALKEKFKVFEGVDNLEEWKSNADKAIETVKNFNDKQLVDAGKVDEIKQQMKSVHQEEIQQIHESYKQSIKDGEVALKGKDNMIYKLMVSSQFAQSPYFTGENPKSTLPPEIAETYFGKYYKVEDDGKGNLRTTGYRKDGTSIYSRKNPGELADFNESLEVIISEYPYKNRILNSSGSGSGAGGGSGTGVETGVDLKISKLQAMHVEAMKAKNGKLALSLKNQIHDLKNKKALGILK